MADKEKETTDQYPPSTGGTIGAFKVVITNSTSKEPTDG